MVIILSPDCDLLSIPFSATTDFTDLADYCDRFAETLIECHDPALKMALYGRINASLALLRPSLGEPIPLHLIDRFIVDTLPDVSPRFEPGAGLLCDYCLALTQVLSGRSLLPETETTLTGLLCELVWYFAADLKAPQWLRTADGLQVIDGGRYDATGLASRRYHGSTAKTWYVAGSGFPQSGTGVRHTGKRAEPLRPRGENSLRMRWKHHRKLSGRPDISMIRATVL